MRAHALRQALPPCARRAALPLEPIRVQGLPAPCIAHHLLQPADGLPVQIALRLGGVGEAGGDVAGAPGRYAVRNRLATGSLEGLDHLEHAVAFAGAQVPHARTNAVVQCAQGTQMALGQVHHMDVVPHAGAIGRRVVVAKHRKLHPPAHCHLGDVGQKIVGGAGRVLADQATFVRAHGIEVAQ